MIFWYEGENNYRLLSLLGNTFTTELLDVPTTGRDIHQIFSDNVSTRQTKYVDILYSGGLDSECILNSCLMQNIPVRAITIDRKSTRLNSSHIPLSRMPSSA